MKLAFSRPTRTAAEQRELFTHFGPVGYTGLQLKASQYRDHVDAPQNFLDQWGEYPGVASGLITSGTLSEESQAALRKLFQFANAVGSERIIFVHGLPRDTVSEDDIRKYARVLSELGKEAQDLGVALSLHQHYNQPVMHRKDMDVFFDAAHDNRVGLTVDTAHLVKSGVEDVAGVIRDFRDVIDNFHMKDYADGEWRVLGRGDIDFTPIFAAIHEIGYDGWICADEESGGDLIGGMKECFQFMDSGLSP